MKPVSPIPRLPRSRIVVGAPVNVHPARLVTTLLRMPPILASGLGGTGDVHATITIIAAP